MPPDVLEPLCNNKLIITGAIPDDIVMGVDVDSMNMSDQVEFDAPTCKNNGQTAVGRDSIDLRLDTP